MHRTALRIGAAMFALAPAVAAAHPGHDGTDLVHGFLHPLGGVLRRGLCGGGLHFLIGVVKGFYQRARDLVA